MNKKKVIYILSLSHSGSTLLDILLSKHFDIVGLGEVYSPIIEKEKNLENTQSFCSCGKDFSECRLWGEYSDLVGGLSKDLYKEKYEKILELVDNYGKNVFVDSSKKLWILNILQELEEDGKIDLKVIYLIRDVRGWAASSANIGKKMEKIRKPFLYHLYSWYVKNKKNKKFLEINKIDYIQISYESLIFNLEDTIKNIFDFSELDVKKFNKQNKPDTHIAYGNRTKGGNHQVIYDTRWMHQYWNNFSLVLLPHIFLWNKKNVVLPKYKR